MTYNHYLILVECELLCSLFIAYDNNNEKKKLLKRQTSKLTRGCKKLKLPTIFRILKMNRQKNIPRLSERDHCGKLQNINEDKTESKKTARNPLADLCENILPQKDLKACTIRKYLNAVSSEVRCRSSSTNAGNDLEVDEVFVSGEEHYVNYLSKKVQTKNLPKKATLESAEVKIVPTVPVVRILGPQNDKEDIKKPAQKTTLTKKLTRRQRNCKTDELYRTCLYDKDYFQDNYRYMIETEGKYVFRKSYLKKYSDENFRMLVVNWLVYVQQVLDLSEQTFFVAIRMFDYLLISAQFKTDKYLLVGITCMWIANKNLEIYFIQVSKLYALCNGRFSRIQIKSMEKDILRLTNFNVNFSEPATFLYYYLTSQKLENNQIVRCSAMFVLETFALLLEFSSSAPSILAAAALYLILRKYKINSDPFMSYIGSHLIAKDVFKQYADQMALSVNMVLKCPKICNEILAKYSAQDKCCVAKDFTLE
ncbi:G2/mitotic-specific cyclin-B3-like isoform X2 [Tenebrio molitor]|uniref:G2/mitotic-specific cyclin-B3-like isoform X2 n=1 Tax=Tenebrio molitor TaxID=7067 RepID=UPI0036249F37